LDDTRDDEWRPDGDAGAPPDHEEEAEPGPEAEPWEDGSAERDLPPVGDLDVPPGFDDDVPPPPWLDQGEAESDEPRTPPKAARYVAFGVVVMAVLGVLMTVTSVQLYLEQQKALDTLSRSIDRISAAYAGPGADDTARRRVAWLRKSVDDRDYDQAQRALDALQKPAAGQRDVRPPGGGEMPGPPGDGEPGDGEMPGPMQAGDLPDAAKQFFAEHEELWEPFFGFSSALGQLRHAGAPVVEELRVMRGSMIEAARMGRAERVEELLAQAREKLEATTGEELPNALQDKLEVFGRAFGQAQRQRRDVSRAARLAQRSEQAARAGDYERAEALLDEAIEAVKRAPRMRAPRLPAGPRGMPPMGPEVGFLRFVADLFAGVMKAEERDLTTVWESINTAADAIRENNAEQIREILGGAVDALRSLGERRREMGRTLDQAQEQMRSAAPRQAPSDDERRQRTEVVLGRISAILARVRELPQEQYEAAREAIARDLLAAMTAPVRTEAPEPAEEMTPEQRVRAKMRIAGQIYLQLKSNTDADMSELDARFDEVRRLIAAHEYEQAEELMDEGVAIMREMRAGAGPRANGGPDVIELEDGTRIDLRGIVGDDAIVPPPPPIEADTATDLQAAPEETEQ